MRVLVLSLALLLVSGCAATAPRVVMRSDDREKVMLDGFVLKVKAYAKEYAKKNKLPAPREDLPKIRIVAMEEELNAIKPKDADKMNRIQCGLCDYKTKTIYALGMDYEALAHEFGHWYFGTDEDRADDFAWFFCHDKDIKSLPILTK